MKHFPIFLAVAGRRIVLSGGGEAAMAKLRLLMKTEAHLTVIAEDIAADILKWAAQGRLQVIARKMEPGDALCAALFYAANEDDAEDARVSAIAAAEGALVNIVDNLADSQFITPAIVDRDPVTVAIGKFYPWAASAAISGLPSTSKRARKWWKAKAKPVSCPHLKHSSIPMLRPLTLPGMSTLLARAQAIQSF